MIVRSENYAHFSFFSIVSKRTEFSFCNNICSILILTRIYISEGSLVSNEKKPRKTIEINSLWLKSTQGQKIVYEVLWQTVPCVALWLSTGTVYFYRW